MPQRAYPRLFTNNVMEIQKTLNQMCDWIFAGGGTGGGGATASLGAAVQQFSTLPDLPLGNQFQPVPGTLMNLGAGSYLVIGFFAFQFDTLQSFCFGGLQVNGATDPHIVKTGVLGAVAAENFWVERTWLVDMAGGGTVQLSAGHQNVAANTFLIAGQSSIMAVKIG